MQPDSPSTNRRSGCLGYALFVVASLWVITATFALQGIAWLVGQELLIIGEPLSPQGWAMVTWGNALLVLLPIGLLALFTRAPRLRATYRTWVLASLLMMAFGLIHLVPQTQTQQASLVQLFVGLAGAGFVLLVARNRGYTPRLRRPDAAPALALAALLATPWLALGALGSPMDAVLNLMAGLTFGLLAGLLLEAFLTRRLAERPSGPGRDIILGGFAAGMALLILGAGFGFGGAQLLLMAALPPLGFVTVALARPPVIPEEPTGRGWLPMAVLIGLVAAAPLALFDPDEITLLLDPEDTPAWAARAAWLSLGLGLLVGFALWLTRGRTEWQRRTGSSLRLPVAAWAGALLLYLAIGQPGFHGERLLVILRDQADLTQAGSIPDRSERTRFVYDRLTEHAQATQAELRATLDRFGVAYRPYYLVNALEVDAGPLVRLYLSRQPEVDRVLDSPRLRPLPRPQPTAVGYAPAPSDPPWNITSIGADRVWRELGVTGQGIVVGQSDSGVEGSHPALSQGYRGRQGGDSYNWLDPWDGTTSPNDTGGHGTHTLGSVLGRDGIGVAPGAQWFGCVNLARNLANPALYLDCMQFMLAPHPQGGDPFREGDPGLAAHVTNNSWGCPPLEGCDPASLAPAVNALRAAGIFVAVSAGNSGPRCGSVTDPIAIYDGAFTVGALSSSGDVAIFSSRGPVEVDGSGRIKPDIAAPGVDVLSSYPGASYQYLDGTSMAGPHVAGVVALMWSAQPKLVGDVERTERILIETARPYQGEMEGCFRGSRPNTAFGYGVVDAYAAVKAAMALE